MFGMSSKTAEFNFQPELSVLVLSSPLCGQKLIRTLYKENLGKESFTLLLHSCQSMQEVPSFLQNSTINEEKKKFDYIILVIEPRLRDCILKAEEEMHLIPNYYLTCSRIFFISSGTSTPDYSIWTLRRKYKCPSLAGNIFDPDSCEYLARRILKLIEFTSGSKTGIPVILSTVQCENTAEQSEMMD